MSLEVRRDFDRRLERTAEEELVGGGAAGSTITEAAEGVGEGPLPSMPLVIEGDGEAGAGARGCSDIRRWVEAPASGWRAEPWVGVTEA